MTTGKPKSLQVKTPPPRYAHLAHDTVKASK